ncbi:MAG: thiamine pyrophosphate-dependent dehydrogenase E1 component subunit alpha [Actinobacteria bacterium]|mgnify:CR=1 FL=1|nr:thiamine pyrophosphate-dependent dehydrogenase E1 component subunit alpha [Actinomycetota bacterium]
MTPNRTSDDQHPSGAAGGNQRRAALRDPIARYGRMLEIRAVEEEVFRLFATGDIHGSTHLAEGQEALAVGLASVIRPDDVVCATYRGHAVALALGMTPLSVISEILGRADGPVGGVGGSMHMSDMEVGLLPTFAIVGAGLPVATGAAYAFQVRAEDRIAVSISGDGSTNIGAFHESLNLAAIWKLPVLFVIDHNMYGEYSRWNVTTPLEDLYHRADSYGIRSMMLDGMDIDAVRRGLGEAVDYVRSNNGPMLIEAKTYRFSGHSRADTGPYRPEGELEHWRERDPVTVTRRLLLSQGLATPTALDQLEEQIRGEVADAVSEAQRMQPAGPAAMFAHVWAEPLYSADGGR